MGDIMDASVLRARQGQRLLQIGIALFIFLSLEGFAVPYFRVPRLGLSVHTLSALSGVLLLATGLLWPKLNLGAMASRIAFWFLLYSDLATIAAYVVAAIFGAGNTTMPLAAGAARGTPFQEALIKVIVYPAAPTVLTALALIFWGLRMPPHELSGQRAKRD